MPPNSTPTTTTTADETPVHRTLADLPTMDEATARRIVALLKLGGGDRAS